MPVLPVGVIDAVVILKGAGDDHAAPRNGIYVVLHLKGYVAAQIDVDFAAVVDVGFVLVQRRRGVEVCIGDRKIHPR